MDQDKKATKSCCCSEKRYETGLKSFSAIVILLTLAVVILSTVFVAQQDALQRYSIEATGGQGALMDGMLVLDSNDNQMRFEFRTYNMSSVPSIHLKGPLPIGSQTGAIAAVLCGGPGPLPSCDVTVPGVIPSTTVKNVWDGINTTGGDVRTLIREIRKNPRLYYIEVPGVVRAPLGGTLGTP